MCQDEFGYERMVHFNMHVGDDEFEIPETASRATWYGVSGIPHVRIDGKYSEVGASNCTEAAGRYRTRINTRLNETANNSPVSIDGSFIPQEGTLPVQATFTKLDNVSLVNLRATILVYENNIYSGGQWWNLVVRDIYDQNITLTNVGDAVTLNQNLPLSPAWKVEDLHVVAYLQQTSGDKQMIQGALLPIGDFVFAVDQRIDSVPLGNGYASFTGVITNMSTSDDVYTLERGTAFGSWSTEFQVGNDPAWYTGPVYVSLPPDGHADVKVRVHTDNVKEVREGSVRCTSQASTRTMESTMRVFNGSWAVLFVDDDSNHNDEVKISTPLTTLGYLYDYWNVSGNNGLSPSYSDMAGFDIMIWDTSWWTQNDPLTASDVTAIKRFMDGGGSFFFTSQLMLNDPPTEPGFLANYLGVQSYELDKAYERLYGVAGDPIGNGLDLPLTFQYPSFKKGDHIVPSATGTICMTTPGGWNATVRNQLPGDGGKSVFMASAWEAISQTDPDPNNATVVLGRILEWLWPQNPADVIDTQNAVLSRIGDVQPNPFEGRTLISYSVTAGAAGGPVHLEVYDLGGRKVATLVDGALEAGSHEIAWDGHADDGALMQSGVYFARLTTRDGQHSEKLVLLK